MDSQQTRILVAEDDESARRIIARTLRDAGFEVHLATNGEMALDIAGKIAPDLVITDIQMPILDGLGVVRRIRDRRSFDSVPILLVSGVDDRDMAIRGLELGASDYITKPFVTQELRARVHAQLRQKQLYDEVRGDRDEIKVLFDMLREATDSLDVVSMLHRITRRVGLVTSAARCSIVLVDRGRGTVVATNETADFPRVHLSLAKYPEIRQAISSRLPVVVDDDSNPELRADLDGVFRSHSWSAILVVPLIFGGQVLGVLMVRTGAGAEPITARALRFVRQVAYALSGLVRLAHQYETFAGEAPFFGEESLSECAPMNELAA